MDKINRGLAMTVVPVALLFLVNGMFIAGEGIFWVQAVASFLFIGNCWLGGWSFFIGLIYLISGTYSVLRAKYLASANNARHHID